MTHCARLMLPCRALTHSSASYHGKACCHCVRKAFACAAAALCDLDNITALGRSKLQRRGVNGRSPAPASTVCFKLKPNWRRCMCAASPKHTVFQQRFSGRPKALAPRKHFYCAATVKRWNKCAFFSTSSAMAIARSATPMPAGALPSISKSSPPKR